MDVLTNKQYKDYNKLSRYSNFPFFFHTIDKKYIYGKTSHLKSDTIYTEHTISPTDTIDKLALYYYNNPTLFWIICDFNRINDPYIKLVPGDKIKIPSISNIEFETY
jgi:hypothetical protein